MSKTQAILNANITNKDVFRAEKQMGSINELVDATVTIKGVSFKENVKTKDGEKTMSIIYTITPENKVVAYFSVANSFANKLKEIADIFSDDIISENGLEIEIKRATTADKRDYFEILLP